MKSIKSKLLPILLCMLSSAVAHEETVQQRFGYFSAGVGPLPIPLPVFGTGYRTQSNHHGMDVSLQASTIVAITQIKTNLLYHYYFKPSYASEFYIGGGIGPSYLFGSAANSFLLSPELVFGKQYRNESGDLRFFQLQTSFPTFSFRNHHVEKFPLVILSYGLGF